MPDIIPPSANTQPDGSPPQGPNSSPDSPLSSPPPQSADSRLAGQSFGMPVSSSGPKPSKKRLWVAITAVAVVLLGAAGYVFAFYLPNTPSHVFSASLVNSGEALDQLINYQKQQAQVHYKSVTLTGLLHVKSATASFDVNFNAAGSKGAATAQATADVAGEHLTADMRVVPVAGSSTADLYLRASGFKHILESEGLGELAKLDNQWILVDHTLLETYAKSLEQNVGSGHVLMPTNNKVPTTAEVEDAEARVQVVNKQYLFTADTSKAVLAGEKYIGQTTQNGRTLNHYTVGYNKAHLAEYISSVGIALDDSKLNAWSKVTQGKNLSQALEISSAVANVKKSDGNYRFDLFVDAKTKLVSKLTFSGAHDKTSTFSIGQQYVGGSIYPFTLNFSDKQSGKPESGMLTLSLNTATHKAGISLSATGSGTDVTANFSITPGNQTITVTAPSGAKSINSVLESLGLGSLANGNLPASAAASANAALTFPQ